MLSCGRETAGGESTARTRRFATGASGKRDRNALGTLAVFERSPGVTNEYTWSTSGTITDGTAYTDFLGKLNNGTSSDGTTISGSFAGHCDWRVPTSAELQAILLAPYPCGTSPCIDAAFGPTVADNYWSSTTTASNPSGAVDRGLQRKRRRRARDR